MARKLSQGYTDNEIIEELRISRSRYFTLKRQIYNIWGNVAAKKTVASIEFEAQVLKDRLTRLQRILELRISQAPPNESISELADASAVAAQIGVTIFKLEYECLRAREERKEIPYVQQKANRYIRDIPVGLPESGTTQTETTGQTEDKRPNDEQSTATEAKVF